MPLSCRPRRRRAVDLGWLQWKYSSTAVASSITSFRIHKPCSATTSHLLGALFVLVFLFSVPSLAQRDPVTNFCRRFGHQTAVIDRKLYIDGGFINYAPLPSNPTNYTNTFLSYHDLDHIGSGGMPQLYSNLSKNATIPTVNGGILWADNVNKNFYLFGGEYFQTPSNDLSLYSFDTLNNYWTTLDDIPQSIVSGVSYGAGVSISELGDAFYYGGWLSNASDPGWAGSRMATTGLIHYDMDGNQWENITGPDNVGRAEGAMVYLPASDKGLLVYFGGIQDPGNGTIIGQPMDEIFVFDMATSRWYKQAANGNVPGSRARFCAGVTWAEDQSSYNVYLYGGLGMPGYTSGYDDVYILSMPSFTWIKMYPNSTVGNQYPHNSLSCNVIDRSQMIIIGGSFPLDDVDCDAQPQFGSHNLDMGEQNADKSPNHYMAKITITMTSPTCFCVLIKAQWFLYQPNITTYVVPSIITNVIGGNAQGAATKTAPDAGFDEPDLKVLIYRKYTAPARAPTRQVSPGAAPPSSSLSSGAIAGISVGAAVALIALLAGLWFCFRRRQKRKNSPEQVTPATSSVVPIRSAAMWSPGSSNHTPATPSAYGVNHAWPAPPFAQAPMPNHPVELPGTVHDSGAREMYGEPPVALHSVVSLGSAGGSSPALVSPHSTTSDPAKYGSEGGWPSPLGGPLRDSYSASRVEDTTMFGSGGHGPQELGTDTSVADPEGRRHDTFYHK
ncbi:hypothetical protein TruAng_010082 [Truncatella angustata]|nr:hypothetical protein TruAng_010082 [Truncatella angustata]